MVCTARWEEPHTTREIKVAARRPSGRINRYQGVSPLKYQEYEDWEPGG